MKPYFFSEGAEREYLEALDFYTRIDPDLGDRFLHEVHSLIDGIREQPDRYPYVARPFRRRISVAFPYAIIYLDEPSLVSIVAVAHFSRRPGYWKGRIDE